MNIYLLPRWIIRTGFQITNALSPTRYPLAASSTSEMFCSKPLFIISSGRAGTTLLRSMLVAGEDIAIPQEFPVLHNLVWYFLRHPHTDWPVICQDIADIIEATPEFSMWNLSLHEAVERAAQLPESERSLGRLIDTILAYYAEQHFPGATHWGEQSPLHTFYTDWIRPIFPQARFLHLLRDGRDVVASFIHSLEQFSLETTTQRWLASINHARHLRLTLPASQFLEVRYEQLVHNPEDTLKKIAKFTDIQYKPNMLKYWQMSSTIEHQYLSHHQNLSRPISTDSIGKWRTRLNARQQTYVLQKLRAELQKLGYMNSA